MRRLTIAFWALLVLALLNECHSTTFSASNAHLVAAPTTSAPPSQPFSYDIYCLSPLVNQTYTPGVTIDIQLPGFFTLNSTAVDELQILAVGAKWAEIMIGMDPQFAGISLNLSLNSDGYQSGVSFSATAVFKTVYDLLTPATLSGQPISLLGPLSSSQTRLINGLATVNTAPIISFSATVPSLSSKFDYPWFYRVCYSDTSRVQLFVDLCNQFNWTKVIMLTTSDLYGRATANAFQSQMPPESVVIFQYDLQTPAEIVQEIHDSGLKILFFLSSYNYTQMVECATIGPACPYNLTIENGYLWIFADAFPFYWVNPPEAYCNNLAGSLIIEAAPGSKWLEASLGQPVPGNPSITTLDVQQMAFQRFTNQTGITALYPKHFWYQEYMPYLVDSVYAVANAYAAVRKSGYSPTGCAVKNALKSISFEGYSGHVEFNDHQDRTVASFSLTTVIAGALSCSDIGFNKIEVGQWSSATTPSLNMFSWPPAWKGKVPVDGVVYPPRPLPIKPAIGIILAVLFSILITAASLFMIIYFRVTRVVSASPISFLASMLVGIVLLLFSLIPITAEPTRVSCVAQLLLTLTGYSVTMASLGTKAALFELFNHGYFKHNILSNLRVLILTSIVSSPSILIGVFVIIADAPKPQVSPSDPTLIACASRSAAGLYSILVFPAILSILTIFLAFRNRNSPVSKDAKFILFAAGNTTLLAILGIGIGFILRKRDWGTVIIIFVIALVVGSLATWGLTYGRRLYRLYVAHTKGKLWKQKKLDQPSAFSNDPISSGIGGYEMEESKPREAAPDPLAEDKRSQLQAPLLTQDEPNISLEDNSDSDNEH